jgi:hypothetical protein
MQKSSTITIRAKIKLLTRVNPKRLGTFGTNFGSRRNRRVGGCDELSFLETTLFLSSGYIAPQALFFEFRLSHKILYKVANFLSQVLQVYSKKMFKFDHTKPRSVTNRTRSAEPALWFGREVFFA